MGLNWSNAEIEGVNATGEIQETGPDITSNEGSVETEHNVEELTEEEVKKNRQEDLEKFKQDLAVKRDLRKQKLNQVSDELSSLRQQLESEKVKRLNLEDQLRKFKNGEHSAVMNDDKTDNESLKYHVNDDSNEKITNRVESLRISKYDDDDEIDILEEGDGNDDKQNSSSVELSENDGQIQEHQTIMKKRKGVKKRVSFSLELVKESDEERQEKTSHDENETVETESTDEVQNENLNDTSENNEEKYDETPDSDEQNESRDDDEDDELKKLADKNEKLLNQIKALKDVVTLHKQLLGIRESQVNELNKKISMVDLKEQDYERKMKAMKELRRLYEERGRAMLVEHQQQLQTERARVNILESKLRFSEDTNEDLAERNKHLEEKVKNLDNTLDQIRSELSETKIKLATEKESLYHASSQISLINNLVSQIVSGPELDLDHLARFLEENHSLINELTTKGDINYVASALVGVAGGIVEVPKEEKSDIAENLGKVWRVLVELLSHHKKTDGNPNGNASSNQEWDSCYKSVDTPKGPKLVISVSQTFIKLKDLILEKNSLVKEVGRLRKLNGHLELRMEEQESRLTLVTEELHNTWDVVNKLKRQHDNLHTHERILKHELQHKRTMLNGLKKQLEICRDQWALAREKNSKTENDWMLLRAEFAMRKQKKKFCNSSESGYEEEETQSPEYDTEDDDKSLEIEEESPENSVGDNIPVTGNTTPSEVSNSEISDDGNGPISEILDSIFDEAIKIANKTKKDSTIATVSTSSKEEETQIQIDSEQDSTTMQKEKNQIQNDRNYNQIERNSTSFNCDTIRKFSLEQIPEVEENAINENWMNDEADTYCSLSSILEDNETERIGKVDPNLRDDVKTDGNNANFKELVKGETDHQDRHNDGYEKRQVTEDSPVNRQVDEDSTTNQEDISKETAGTKSETGSLKMDEILRRRDERFRRMEESCKSLFVKMGQTSNRSNEISNKLDQIHAAFGPQQSSSEKYAEEYFDDPSLNLTGENHQSISSDVQSDLNTEMSSTNLSSGTMVTSQISAESSTGLSINLTNELVKDIPSSDQVNLTAENSLNLTDDTNLTESSLSETDIVTDVSSNLTKELQSELTSSMLVQSNSASELSTGTSKDLTSSLLVQSDPSSEL